jgi:hypothetical protein
MSIGSAFDAYVKAELHSALFGPGADPAFGLDALLDEQVEEHNRDWARDHGKYAFESYKLTGAYDDLLDMLQGSEYDPEFEFTATGSVEGVPLMGKPDCRFIHANGTHYILDWKVNGYCSKHGASPSKYYARIRDGWDATTAKASRGCGNSHPKFDADTLNGLEVSGHPLEESSTVWAMQLAIYSWMLGEPVGDENVLMAIDQLACKAIPGGRPLIRVAQHRARISKEYQTSLVNRLTYAWKCVTTGYIFDDMERDENDQRCEELDTEALALAGDGTADGDWFTSVCRTTRFY